ncbi:MAG: hypothetical protein ACLP7J_02305 [Streptosporangiaceae bacterium]
MPGTRGTTRAPRPREIRRLIVALLCATVIVAGLLTVLVVRHRDRADGVGDEAAQRVERATPPGEGYGMGGTGEVPGDRQSQA